MWVGRRRVYYTLLMATIASLKDDTFLAVRRRRPRGAAGCRSAPGIWCSPRSRSMMLVPLLWMVILSLETTARGVELPAGALPLRLHFSNYSTAWNAVPFGDFFLNSLALLARDGRRQPAVLQPRRLRVRAASASSGATCCSSCCWRR